MFYSNLSEDQEGELENERQALDQVQSPLLQRTQRESIGKYQKSVGIYSMYQYNHQPWMYVDYKTIVVRLLQTHTITVKFTTLFPITLTRDMHERNHAFIPLGFIHTVKNGLFNTVAQLCVSIGTIA